jgi:hypothetical protein
MRSITRRVSAALLRLASSLALAVVATQPAAASALPVPAFDHIFTILMENHSYSEIIGDTTDAPYLHSLATTYGLGSNRFAVSHPSLPNYLALTGGSTFGVTTDCNPSTCTQNQPNIAADRIVPAGKTWKAYMESMPSNCLLSDSGEYAVRHNPFVYYTDIQTTSQCNNDVPYTQFATDIQSASTTPNYAWITPNLINDMHDGTIAQGDIAGSARDPGSTGARTALRSARPAHTRPPIARAHPHRHSYAEASLGPPTSVALPVRTRSCRQPTITCEQGPSPTSTIHRNRPGGNQLARSAASARMPRRAPGGQAPGLPHLVPARGPQRLRGQGLPARAGRASDAQRP